MKSAQGVYPICSDHDSASAFAEFIHTQGTRIFQAATSQWAPRCYVSLIEGARAHIVKTGSTSWIFRPESQTSVPGKAKYFFPGFTIRFIAEHQFVNSSGVLEVLSPMDYQGQFHKHDGQGRLTIDVSSFPLAAEDSRNPHFTAEFTYYSLPLISDPVTKAWNATKQVGPSFVTALTPRQAHGHDLAVSEYLRIHGVTPIPEPHAGPSPPARTTDWVSPIPSHHGFLQAELEAKLQELVAADAAATQAFVEQRQRMVRESQEVAHRLQLLQNLSSGQHYSQAAAVTLLDRPPLPSHFYPSFSSTPAANTAENIIAYGPAHPQHVEPGLAAPSKLAQGLEAPQIVALQRGSPRSEGDNQE
jgi:hypothetical protein